MRRLRRRTGSSRRMRRALATQPRDVVITGRAARCLQVAGTFRVATLDLEDIEMATYILLGGGFGLALLIAAWGIWKLR